jgi:hypothetical protein
MQVNDEELRVPLAQLQSSSGYTSTHLYRSARDGRIAGAVRIDGRWMVPISTVAQWTERACRRQQKHTTKAGRRTPCPRRSQ